MCRECRDNEVIIENSSCRACPATFWPDQETATVCKSIEPTYMKPVDIIASSLIALNAMLLIITISIISLFYKHRNKKLVKASGVHFMGLIMAGITLAYITVFVFIMKPTTEFCYFTHLGFNVAATIIYAPLLVKTSRVYRIFVASDNFSQNLKCVSLPSQLIITNILIMIQVRYYLTSRGKEGVNR